MDRNRKSQIPDRYVSVQMTLSDTEWCDVMGPIFLADLHSYTGTFCSRMTQFGTVTYTGRGVYLGINHDSYPNRAGQKVQPPHSGTVR